VHHGPKVKYLDWKGVWLPLLGWKSSWERAVFSLISLAALCATPSLCQICTWTDLASSDFNDSDMSRFSREFSPSCLHYINCVGGLPARLPRMPASAKAAFQCLVLCPLQDLGSMFVLLPQRESKIAPPTTQCIFAADSHAFGPDVCLTLPRSNFYEIKCGKYGIVIYHRLCLYRERVTSGLSHHVRLHGVERRLLFTYRGTQELLKVAFSKFIMEGFLASAFQST